MKTRGVEDMMSDEVSSLRDLEPIRYRTVILNQIAALSEERRRLLGTITRFGDPTAGRNRVSEIDEQLTELWEIRRRELL